MRTVIDGVLTRKRTMLMIFLLLIISGLSSYINIPKESDAGKKTADIY